MIYYALCWRLNEEGLCQFSIMRLDNKDQLTHDLLNEERETIFITDKPYKVQIAELEPSEGQAMFDKSVVASRTSPITTDFQHWFHNTYASKPLRFTFGPPRAIDLYMDRMRELGIMS